MDITESIKLELMNANKTIGEQAKLIEEKDKTIENLNRELIKCKTEYELLENRNKELKQELASINKIIEDVKAVIESKDTYIKSLEKEKKQLTWLNIGLVIAILILIALFIVFSFKQ